MFSLYKNSSPHSSESFLKMGMLNERVENLINSEEIIVILKKEISALQAKNQKAKAEEEIKKKDSLKKLNTETKDKRFKAKRKAPIPVFSKESISDYQDEEEKNKVSALDYKDKFKPLKEDPNYIQMKATQDKAESALRKWKKDKLESYKRGGVSKKRLKKKSNTSTDRKSLKSRGSKMGKGISLYQTGKAIVFQ